jgi:hypothetical protein
MGQGIFSAFLIMTKEMINKIAVITKRASFLSVNQINWGKLAVRLAKLAPIPNETKVTGRAQHKSVLSDPKEKRK